MKDQRILAFSQSRKLTEAELENISAAGLTRSISGRATYSSEGGWDPAEVDVSVDW